MAQELSIKAWAITGALLWGLYLFIAALIEMANVEFVWFSTRAFELFVVMYPGLNASLSGALLGLVYGAICGAICFGVFSGVHNWILKWLK